MCRCAAHVVAVEASIAIEMNGGLKFWFVSAILEMAEVDRPELADPQTPSDNRFNQCRSEGWAGWAAAQGADEAGAQKTA